MGELARYDAEGLLTRLSSAEEIECDERGTDVDPGTSVCEPANGIPFAFNSLFRSSTTGLVYMRNRWYAPRLGQFISHDPLEYVDSSNLYAFASFDSINNWDPLGLDAQDLTNSCDQRIAPCANANYGTAATTTNEDAASTNPCVENPAACNAMNATPLGLEHLDPTTTQDHTSGCPPYMSCEGDTPTQKPNNQPQRQYCAAA